MNVSAVNIALPTIETDLKFSASALTWVVNAYTLTFGSFLLVGGKLGDKYGHKLVFMTGLLYFSAWSLVCGLSKSAILLCVARAMQGMGAAFTIPNALALIQFSYPEEVEKSRAISIFSSSGALGFGIGLVLGGVLTATIGWDYLFHFSAIFGVLVSIISLFTIKESSDEKRHEIGLDPLGALTITAGLLALVYGLSDGQWKSAQVITTLVLGVALLCLFVFVETKVKSPMLPMYIFRTRMFSAMLVIGALYQSWYLIYNFYTTLMFQNVMRYTPMQTALAFFPLAFPGLVLNPMAGYLVPKLGAKPLLIVGTACMALGAALFAITDAESSYWPLPCLSMCISEVGIALTYTSAMVSALSMAKTEEHGLNSAVFQVAMQVGSGIGLAVTNTIAEAVVHSSGSMLKGYQVGLWIGFSVTTACVVITFFFVPTKEVLEKKKRERALARAAALDEAHMDSPFPEEKMNKEEGGEKALEVEERADRSILDSPASTIGDKAVVAPSDLESGEHHDRTLGRRASVGSKSLRSVHSVVVNDPHGAVYVSRELSESQN
ncbi:hypothetical protein DFQ26_005283 [Actinomortierella ambigua]|nr:hypothetical protein DFQ26_005283 [Actinomortierella ambigua]